MSIIILIILKPIKPSVRNALVNAFERLVASLKVSAPRLVQPESLRQVVIVLQVQPFICAQNANRSRVCFILKSPMLLDLEYHKTILGPLIRAISYLPDTSKAVLVKWWAQMNVERLRTFLGTS